MTTAYTARRGARSIDGVYLAHVRPRPVVVCLRRRRSPALCAPARRARRGSLERAEQLLRTHPRAARPRAPLRHRRRGAGAVRAGHPRAPRDPAPHIVLARALTIADPLHPEACRPRTCERAIDELKEARRLDAGGAEAQRIAAELGLVLSRIGSLRGGARRVRPRAQARRPRASPERLRRLRPLRALRQLRRDADGARPPRRRHRALSPGRGRRRPQGDLEWELAEWGLGVALDRDEQIEKSREAIGRALDVRPDHVAPRRRERLLRAGRRQALLRGARPRGRRRSRAGAGRLARLSRRGAVVAVRAPRPRPPGRAQARAARRRRRSIRRACSVTIGEIVDLRGLRPAPALRDAVGAHLDELRLCYARVAAHRAAGARRAAPAAASSSRRAGSYTRARVLLSTVADGAPRPLRRAGRHHLALPAQRRHRAGGDRRHAVVRGPLTMSRPRVRAASLLAGSLLASVAVAGARAPRRGTTSPSRTAVAARSSSTSAGKLAGDARVEERRRRRCAAPSRSARRTALRPAARRRDAPRRPRARRRRACASSARACSPTRAPAVARGRDVARLPPRLRARGHRRSRRRHRRAPPPRGDGRPAAAEPATSSTTTSATS